MSKGKNIMKHVSLDKTIIRYNIKIYRGNMGRMDESRNSLAQIMDQWWALLNIIMSLPVTEFGVINE
jgi:hypothetical protein